jgi:hypothetical protein
VARQAWPLPARWAWWLAHRPALLTIAASAVLVGVQLGLVVLAVVIGVAAAGLVGCWRQWPDTFHRWPGRVLLGVWRSLWDYGVRWRAAMMLSGLGGRFDGAEYAPRVVRVRAGRFTDRVTVRIVVGQHPPTGRGDSTPWRTASVPGPARCANSPAGPAMSI